MVVGKQVLPVGLKLRNGAIHLLIPLVLFEQDVGRFFINNIWSYELLRYGVFAVAEDEDEGLRLARRERHIELVGAYRGPAVGYRPVALSLADGLGHCIRLIEADKLVPGGVEAVDRCVY